MGFYGNLSGSNKSAFTFDKVYPTRKEMDRVVASDDVFLGRYVLVEYDEPPIAVVKVTSNGTTGYKYAGLAAAVDPFILMVNGLYYAVKLNNKLIYFRWDSTATPPEQYDNGDNNVVTPFQVNYSTDVNQYGRGYDGTVWRKIYDTTKSGYRYVLLAELNAAVPNFFLVPQPPTDSAANGGRTVTINTDDSTNLNYYIYTPSMFGHSFATMSTAPAIRGVETSSAAATVGTSKIPDIQIRRIGFDQDAHIKNEAAIASNTIGVTGTTSSGTLYKQSLTSAGLTAQDIKLWSIRLPAIGQAVSDIYDILHGITNTAYTNNDLITHRARILLDVTPTTVSTVNMYLRNNQFSYWQYAPSFTSVSGNGGAYVKDGSDYFLKNPHVTYLTTYNVGTTLTTQNYKLTTLTGQYNGLYATYLTMLLKLGIGDTSSNYNTVQGAINTLKGVVKNIGSLYTKCIVYTDENGRIITNSGIGKEFPKANSTELLAHDGTWVSRYATIGVTNETYDTYNSIKFTSTTGDVTSTTAKNNKVTFKSANKWVQWQCKDDEKTITIAHVRNELNPTNMTTKPILSQVVSTSPTYEIGPWILEESSDWTSGKTSTENLSKSLINIPSYTFDMAGHLTGYENYSFYLPHGFKTIQYVKDGNATSTTNSITSTSSTIVADNAVDTLTLKTGNLWVNISGSASGDSFTFAHKLSGITSEGVASTTPAPSAGASWSENSINDNKLTIPYYTIDAAGHITAHSFNDYYLPNNYKTITIAALSSANNAEGTTVADTISPSQWDDTLQFATGNKWIRLVGADDKITIYHAKSSLAASTIEPVASFTGWNNTSDNEITIPEIQTDYAGHVISTAVHSFYMPHGYKTLTADTVASTATGAITTATLAMSAENSADEFKFNTGNKWIELRGDSKSLTIAHNIVNATFGTSISPSGTMSTVTDNTITIPTITFDNAGHITAHSIKAFNLPHNVKTITVSSGNSGTSAVTNTSANITATLLGDTFIIQPGNKWLNFAGNSKTITVGHETVAVNTATTTTDLNNANTFRTIELAYDEAGHITASTTTTHTLPYNWKTITTINSDAVTAETGSPGTITASSPVDGFTLAASNKWLHFAANDKTINIGHSTVSANTVAYSSSYELRPPSNLQFGGVFDVLVPSITIEADEAGHILSTTYDSTTTAITIPKGHLSVSDRPSVNTAGNVLVNFDFTDASGEMVTSYDNIGNLAITGYTTESVTAATLAATDTLNMALAKLEKLIEKESADRANAISTSEGTAEGLYAPMNHTHDYAPTASTADPYALESYVNNYVNNKIIELLNNYNILLKMPTLILSHNNESLMLNYSNILSGDYNARVWKKNNDNIWEEFGTLITINNEQSSYTVDDITPGTYKVVTMRTYNDMTNSMDSEEYIIPEINNSPD